MTKIHNSQVIYAMDAANQSVMTGRFHDLRPLSTSGRYGHFVQVVPFSGVYNIVMVKYINQQACTHVNSLAMTG